jgi:hypothetical protein
VCEHAFVLIKGGSYQRFRRALEIGDPTLVPQALERRLRRRVPPS